MKHCRKCSRDLPRKAFHKNNRSRDGLQAWCCQCRSAYNRTPEERAKNRISWRRYAQSDYGKTSIPAKKKRTYEKNKMKWRPKDYARQALHRAIKRGEVLRLRCENCGNPRSQAHHHDYSKPLDVIWLCQRCHAEEHLKAG